MPLHSLLLAFGHSTMPIGSQRVQLSDIQHVGEASSRRIFGAPLPLPLSTESAKAHHRCHLVHLFERLCLLDSLYGGGTF